jgi:Protein of unknown function (DUF2934)
MMATRKTTTSRKPAKTKATSQVAGSNGHVQSASNHAPIRLSPSEEEIRMRAYELFVMRGGTHGDDLADWFTAVRDLMR